MRSYLIFIHPFNQVHDSRNKSLCICKFYSLFITYASHPIPIWGYEIQRLPCPWSLIGLYPSFAVRILTRRKAWHHPCINLHIPLPSGHSVRVLYRHVFGYISVGYVKFWKECFLFASRSVFMSVVTLENSPLRLVLNMLILLSPIKVKRHTFHLHVQQ